MGRLKNCSNKVETNLEPMENNIHINLKFFSWLLYSLWDHRMVVVVVGGLEAMLCMAEAGSTPASSWQGSG